jgi:cytochrome P450
MEAPSYESYIHRKTNRNLAHIPGSYGYPLIGQTIQFIDSPLEATLTSYRKYGPVFRQSLGFQHIVGTVGPEFIKQISLDSDKVFSSRTGWEDMVGEFFEGSLIVQDFDDHRLQRRLMQTAFKTESLRGYVSSINEIISDQLADWSVQQPLLFYPAIKALLLDISAKVFLGAQLNEEGARINKAFVDYANGATSVIKKDWPGLPYHKGLKGRRVLEQFIRQSIEQKRAGDGADMFSYFCREKNQQGYYYSDQEITDHMLFLLFAAHDTTTSALTMVMHLLASNQDWQGQLRETVNASTTGALNYEQLGADMPLLDYTFKEVLRLYPPVPGVVRRTIQPCEIGGYEVPAHTLVQTSIVATQYMEEYWRDPFAFDPLRFSDARQEHKQHAYLWAPFGGGAHKCIGLHFADMLFKCVLFQVLKKHRVNFVDETQRNGKIKYVPFTRPKDNLPLVFSSDG